jgi:hypothetical protein
MPRAGPNRSSSAPAIGLTTRPGNDAAATTQPTTTGEPNRSSTCSMIASVKISPAILPSSAEPSSGGDRPQPQDLPVGHRAILPADPGQLNVI